MLIESLNNQKIKNWKKLHARKNREKQEQYLLEGEHLVEEAVKQAPELIDTIIIDESQPKQWGNLENDYNIVWVTEEISDVLAQTETSQGIFAVMNKKEESKPEQLKAPYLLLDGVQDPGNVGTMIRTAVAAGFQGVVFGKGTVDMYNDKVLRSAQGTHFACDIQAGDLEEWIEYFQSKEYRIYGTDLNPDAVDYRSVTSEKNSSYALIVGNEGAGVDEALLEKVDQSLYIPISGRVESLNVAIAAAILMFSLE